MRREHFEIRKATLDVLLGRRLPGIHFNEHIEEDGPIVFQHACKLGLEGIRLEAQGFVLRLGTLATLDQIEEPERAGSEAGGGRGLEPLSCLVEFIASISYNSMNRIAYPTLLKSGYAPGGMKSY
jgi:hypothetical protein